jgi:hypothetical protein
MFGPGGLGWGMGPGPGPSLKSLVREAKRSDLVASPLIRAMLAVDLPDASTPTPEPTIADLMREVLAIRDRLAGLEQRVWQCQCALVRLDGSLAALASRVDDLAF